MNEKFIKGLFLSKREGSPDFVKGTLSFKTEDFIKELPNYTNAKGYANVDILESKDGQLYIKPNLYGLTTKIETKSIDELKMFDESKDEEIDIKDIPF